MIRNKITEGEVIDVVDLLEPRPCRVQMFSADDELVSEFAHGEPGKPEEWLSPESCAWRALHADGVTRVKVYDAADGELLIDRSDQVDASAPGGVHGHLG